MLKFTDLINSRLLIPVLSVSGFSCRTQKPNLENRRGGFWLSPACDLADLDVLTKRQHRLWLSCFKAFSLIIVSYRLKGAKDKVNYKKNACNPHR